ncbi:MAG: cyclodeaminase/cyclohydrolase family protein [Phascolarctobacterium sp.]|nr:cyclodeaminase/cyclohydrolase family protein [Phascolarctobacterium sp.]
MSSFAELSNEEFLSLLASHAPAPGGGGASAMAGALGAALSSMVGNLTVGKEAFAAQEEQIVALLSEATSLREKLLQCADEDAKVFEYFMSVYKLPKQTEEEKRARTQAIRSAAKKAASIPLEIARSSFAVLKISVGMAKFGNPNVITDATCSAILAYASLRCAAYNVFVNLSLTKDEAFNKAARKELADMQHEGYLLEEKVINRTNEVLG